MKKHLNEIIPSFLITVLIMVILDIFSATIFPLIGFDNFRLPFNILIILYMGLKLEHPSLAIFIFLLQYTHSFFTVEGWAMGTAVGIIVWIGVSYIRELLHFSSGIVTGTVVFIFQVIWFALVAVFTYLKMDNFDFVTTKLLNFIPACIILSFISPFFFAVLDRIWKGKNDSSFVGDMD